MFMAKISCWFVEYGKPKNIHGFWSLVHKHWYGKVIKRLHSVDAQVSAADGTGMVKERLSTLTWRIHNDLSSEVFDGSTKEAIENCRLI